MSVPTDSSKHALLLESCLGAIPSGWRQSNRGKHTKHRANTLDGAGQRGNSAVLVRVRTQSDVVRLVRIAQSQGLAVVSPGWLLGSSSAATRQAAGVRIDLSRLDRIRTLSKDSAVAESGIALSQIDKAVRRQSRTLGRTLRNLHTPAGSLAAQIIDFMQQARVHPLVGQLLSVKLVSVSADPQIHEFGLLELQDWLQSSGCNALLLEVELAVYPRDAAIESAPAQRSESNLV